MGINEMNIEQVEARMAELFAVDDAEETLEQTTERRDELKALEARKQAIMAEAAEKRALLEEIANSNITPIEEIEERTEKMENIEMRNTPEYIHAFANYVKTGNDAECRALLTENGSGTVAVPELVYDTVKTAWQKEGVMSLVRKAYLKGNLKVGFEISSSPAEVHTEGVAVDEESLVLGVVELVPQAIKKWISISDEALDMADVPYLQYIYDELTYRIAKQAADTLLGKIVAAGTASTTTAVSVAAITEASIGLGTIAKAMATLADGAANPAIVMNKATWGAFKAAQAAASYAYDVFEGLPVVFNNSLTAYSAATTGVTYAIVGDFGSGALANFPAGDSITIKRDDLTLATSDLVRFIGREYVGLGIVAPDHFCKIKK